MIMNKLWLKITGITALILGLIILLYAFWPAETRIQDEDKRDLEAQWNAQYPEAEELYQTVLAHKEQPSPRDDRDYIIVVDCCQWILRQYPDSPQAEKARELLQEVPEQYRKQYAEEMRPRLPSKPAVRKSRPLRRRVSRSYPQPHYILGEDVNRPD